MPGGGRAVQPADGSVIAPCPQPDSIGLSVKREPPPPDVIRVSQAQQPNLIPLARSAFAVSFDDGLGDVSNATLDLAVNVPEPGTYALIMGVVATGLIVGRRRRG